MKTIPIRKNGLVATLFHSGNLSSVIIVLGGASGGLNEERAERLASYGFSTLALAYFAYESLPATLKEIPLEYFEKAISLLRLQFGFKQIALWGGSRGAELALILGTLFPTEIAAIAAHVPSSVIHGTLDYHNDHAWTFHGKPLAPQAPFKILDPLQGEAPETPIASTPFFFTEDQVAFAASAIPVEKIRCPLLLISAQDDQMWPSSLFCTANCGPPRNAPLSHFLPSS